MKILPDPIDFVWDRGNIDKNVIKHGVTNKEAEEAFMNRPFVLFEDKEHSEIEKRYGLFGRTDKGRRLSIVFTLRENKMRVIMARDMSRKERRVYEKVETETNSKV